jgi:hypothetical protein
VCCFAHINGNTDTLVQATSITELSRRTLLISRSSEIFDGVAQIPGNTAPVLETAAVPEQTRFVILVSG